MGSWGTGWNRRAGKTSFGIREKRAISRGRQGRISDPSLLMVRSRRLELPQVALLAPQASASTVPPRPHGNERAAGCNKLAPRWEGLAGGGHPPRHLVSKNGRQYSPAEPDFGSGFAVETETRRCA